MDINLDLNVLALIESPVDRRRVTRIDVKRGDAWPVTLRFYRGSQQVRLPEGTQITFAAKENYKYDTTPVVYTPPADWTESTPPAAPEEDTDPYYTAAIDLNSANLAELLGVDGTPTNDKRWADLMAEITWISPGSDLPTSTGTFLIRVQNDVWKGEEFTPLALPSPESWLTQRSIRFDVAQDLSEIHRAQAIANLGITLNSSDEFLLSRANHTGTQTAATISDFNAAVAATPPSAHSHGALTSDGRIGSLSNLVVITGANGALNVVSRTGIDTRTSFPNASVTAATSINTGNTLVLRGANGEASFGVLGATGILCSGDISGSGITANGNIMMQRLLPGAVVANMTFLATITANRLITFPDASGTVYLINGALGTPAGGNLANCNGLPVGGITGMATNIPAFLIAPTPTNLRLAMTSSTGTGNPVFAEAPTINNPQFGGTAAFTGSARPTTSATGTPAANSLISLSDADAVYLRLWDTPSKYSYAGAVNGTGITTSTAQVAITSAGSLLNSNTADIATDVNARGLLIPNDGQVTAQTIQPITSIVGRKNVRTWIIDMSVDFRNNPTPGGTRMFIGLDTSINDLSNTANLWGSNVFGFGVIFSAATSGNAALNFFVNSASGVLSATEGSIFGANLQNFNRLIFTESIDAGTRTYRLRLLGRVMTFSSGVHMTPLYDQSIVVPSAQSVTGGSARLGFGLVVRTSSHSTNGIPMSIRVNEAMWH